MKTSPKIRNGRQDANSSKWANNANGKAAMQCESCIEIKFEDRSNDFKERLTLLEVRLCGGDLKTSNYVIESDSETSEFGLEIDTSKSSFAEVESEPRFKSQSDGEPQTNNSVLENDTCAAPPSLETESETRLKPQNNGELETSNSVLESGTCRPQSSETETQKLKESETRLKPQGDNGYERQNHLHSHKCDKETNGNAPKKKKVKIYMCKICKVKFKEMYIMANHLRSHTVQKPFSCIICNAKFYLRTEVRKHMNYHYKEGSYENEFSNRVKLGRPVKVPKLFECTICQSKFECDEHLKVHLKIHSLEKPNACAVCNLRFSKKSDLVTHYSVHNGDLSSL